MFQRTASPLSISDSATKRRRSVGLQKVIRIAPVMPLGTLGLSRYSTRCAAIRVSRRSSKKFLRLKRAQLQARVRYEPATGFAKPRVDLGGHHCCRVINQFVLSPALHCIV